MGADMILAMCPHPQNVGLDSDEAATAALRRWALEMTQSEADVYWDAFSPDGEDTVSEGYAERDVEPLEELAEAGSPSAVLSWAQRFVAAELEAAYIQATESRAVAKTQIAGQVWWIAGGMSWGDEPEGCNCLRKLDFTCVFDLRARQGCLDLSTAHIPPDILKGWNSENLMRHAFGWRVVAHEHGWMVFLGDNEGDKKAAPWCQPILRLARAVNCDFINFDKDGDVCAHLPDLSVGTPIEQLAGATSAP
jgi:hypothetical protein